MQTADTLTVTVLPDGRIRIDSDDLSGPNHTSAENLVKLLSQLAGGETTVTRKRPTTIKTHSHTHTHQ